MARSLLSQKRIPHAERLIFPLDVPSAKEARALVTQLGDSVKFYKIGLQLLMSGEYFDLIRWLRAKKKKIFCDIKFNDIPETVRLAIARLAEHDADFVTVHGERAMLKAAVESRGKLQILAVTVLTSLNLDDLLETGFRKNITARDLVLLRAKMALETGCTGVICSGQEAPFIRAALGPKLTIVCPGIRPPDNMQDHKRVVDVEQAFANGADYIVVGRPIRNAPDPQAKAREIQRRIAAVFGKRR